MYVYIYYSYIYVLKKLPWFLPGLSLWLLPSVACAMCMKASHCPVLLARNVHEGQSFTHHIIIRLSPARRHMQGGKPKENQTNSQGKPLEFCGPYKTRTRVAQNSSKIHVQFDQRATSTSTGHWVRF